MTRRGPVAALAGLLGALVLVAGAPGADARDPATCDPGSEVLVLVAGASGEAQATCVAAGDHRSASRLFEEAGRELTRVQRFPGAVCRVDGVPAENPCVAMPPADRYWGFFHASGNGWEYAALGVDAVQPEPGDAIALVWQSSNAQTPPTTPPGGVTADTSDAPDGPAGEPDAVGVSPLVPGLVLVGLVVAAAVLAVRSRR